MEDMNLFGEVVLPELTDATRAAKSTAKKKEQKSSVAPAPAPDMETVAETTAPEAATAGTRTDDTSFAGSNREPPIPAQTALTPLISTDRAAVGAPFAVPCGALSIATDNPWGRDAADDEAFRRVLAAAPVPTDLDPILVVKYGNGWSIVGDPAALIAVARVHKNDADLASVELQVREVTGSKAAIVLHTARQALGGRAFKNMRRARLALSICETEGLNGKAVAAQLGLHGSGTTRDLKAARMEREHPVLGEILTSPSEAPVSYYTDLRDHADRQPSPNKAMASIVAIAAKLAKANKTFTAADAKIALGIKAASLRKDPVETRIALKTTGYVQGATVERSASGSTRLIVSLPSDDVPVALLEKWLAAANPMFEEAP